MSAEPAADCLLDTNLWVYAVSHDTGDALKRQEALRLIATARLGVSAQIMAEFFNVTTRKLQVKLKPAEALAWIDRMGRFPTAAIDHALVVRGIAISDRYGISYWDAAVIAAAEALGAGTLYSEDLAHGQKYGQVTVVNPFK